MPKGVPVAFEERARVTQDALDRGVRAASASSGYAPKSIYRWINDAAFGLNPAPLLTEPPAHLDPEGVEHAYPEYVDKKTGRVDLDRCLQLAMDMQRVVADMGTGQGELTVKIDADRPITWAPSADWHLMSYATDHAAFVSFFQKVVDTPHLYGSVHGDETDNFQKGFRSAAAVFGQIFPPQVQKHLLCAIYERLAEKGKVLWRGWGNHVEDFDDMVVGGAIDRFNEIVPFLKHEGRVHLWVGDQEYKINTKHSFPGNSYMNANHANKRAARYDWQEAQVVVSGHTHRGSEWDRFWVDDRMVLSLVLPTFKTNCTYSLRNYGRSRVQEPAIVLFPREHKVVPFDDLDTALEFAEDQARRRTVHAT